MKKGERKYLFILNEKIVSGTPDRAPCLPGSISYAAGFLIKWIDQHDRFAFRFGLINRGALLEVALNITAIQE